MAKGSSGRDRRRSGGWIALLLIAGVGCWWALSLDFLADDAFITFRYARNLESGHGLVYNPGERVEGYTNFLLVLLLAGLHGLGVDLVSAGRGLSLAASVATVVLTWAIARRILNPAPASLPLGAALLVAVNPFQAAWAGAGMETTLFSALLAAATLAVVGAVPSERRVLAASACGLAAFLTRPEGAALYLVIAACAMASAEGTLVRRLRTLAPGLLLFFAVAGVYFASRWLYFGDLLPNTFYAKSAFSPDHVRRGLAYLGEFVRNGFVLTSLPLVAVGFWGAWRRRALALVFVPLAILAIVVAEGGDGLPMFRFLVPALPCLAVLVALGLQFTREKVGPLGPVGVLNLVAIAWLSFYPAQGPLYKSFRYQRDVELPAWSAVGRALATSFPPETLVAAVPIGAVGYYSNLRIIDLVGLTDRTIARTPAPRLGSGWPGHEKHNGPYVLSRRPEILLLGNVYVDARSELPAGAFPPFSNRQIRAREGDIVTDPRFSSEYELRHLAVESGRWLHFFARTDLAPSRP